MENFVKVNSNIELKKSQEKQVTIIRPKRGLSLLDLRELWEYRELLYFLTWRDIIVRYKQTVIGVAWAVLQPLVMMIVFTLFFGKLAKIPSEGIPYPIFTYSGLLPWQLFSRTLSDSSNSLLRNQRLITRAYFPRIIAPLSTTLVAVVDFLISAVLLVILMFIYGITPSANIIFLPIFILLLLTTALGVGLWLSVLNVEYRDIAYVLPFLNQLWLFLTPVVYPSTIVPEKWRILYGFNPMTGVVDGFRWALFGVGEGISTAILVSSIIAILLFTSGIIWFNHKEQTFADEMGS